MPRHPFRSFLTLLILALALVLPSNLSAQGANAKKKPGAKPAAQPATSAEETANKAQEVLDTMAKFYDGLKTLKVNARTEMKMNMQGMDMDIKGTSAIAAERPNKFSSVSQGEGMMAMALSNTMISDGTKLIVYMPMMKSYTEKEAPANFAGLVGNSTGGAGAEAFIVGLLSSDTPGASLFDGVENPTYVGIEDIGGIQCHHLRLSTVAPGLDTMGMGEMKMDLWVETGDKPYVRRIKPDFSEVLSQLSGAGDMAALGPEAKACQENLLTIDGMKQQWALEKSAKAGDKLNAAEFQKYMQREMPKCPSGEGYALNPIGAAPLCLSGLEGHDLASAAAVSGLEGVEGLEDMGAMLEGMEMEMSFEYDGWESDVTIAPEAFVFAPPAGAQMTDNLFGDLGLGDQGNIGGLGVTEESDPAKALEGKLAPPFKLKLAGGGEFDVAAEKGKNIVILDFWATWCGPCRNSMPNLIKLAKEYEGKGVILVSVNLEEAEEDVLAFIKKEGWDVKVALDSDYSVGALYMAEAIPETVIIGKDGIVAEVHVGASPKLADELRESLDALLAAQP